MANQPTTTIEAILRLIPELEELDGLRMSIIKAGVPDPTMEWSRSGALSTVDKRLLPPQDCQDAITEAERALTLAVADTFTRYRQLFRDVGEGRPSEATTHLIGLGEQKERIGLYRSAKQFFEVALSYSGTLPDKGPQVLALLRLGRVTLRAGDIAEGVQYYQRAAELARDAEDREGLIAAHIGLGYPLALQGRWPEAERSHREALELLGSEPLESDHQLERGQIFNNLGYFAARQGRLTEAVEWLRKSESVWKEVDSPPDLGVYHHCMAFVCKAEGALESALEHYGSALALEIPASFRVGISIDMAEAWLLSGNVSKANDWIHRAEEEAIAARAPYVLGRVYQARGNIARTAGVEDGFIFYEKALEIARARGLHLLEGETLMDYALLRIQMEAWDEARSYLELAGKIFEDAGAAPELAKVEEHLSTLATLPDQPSSD